MRWLVCLLLIGCGDDGSAPVDAAPIDSRPDSGGSGCDYSEQQDATNDTSGSGTAEDTQLQLAAPLTLCGAFESTHFDGDITVDADAFHFSVPTEMDVAIRLEANASTVELAGVDIYSGATFSTLVGTATWYGDHAVTSVHLMPGTYELLPFALNAAAIASTISYRLQLSEDLPDRCAPIASGGVAEANDGANNTGNDVYSVPSGSPVALTADNSDAPEPVGDVAPGTPVRISGTLADVALADQYEDRDTFTFEVPNGANELSVRLDWQAAGDLDFMLFEGTNVIPETRVLRASTTGPEQLFYAIKAGVPYSIMFAAKPGATFPVEYTAALCSERYP